jgi:hypothetical protein
MLDYIISHGKLREKHARKFARQILSALDYCHRNSIVHRGIVLDYFTYSRSQNRKYSYLEVRKYQDHRFWIVKSLLQPIPTHNLLRVVILRRSGVTQCKGIHRPGGGYLEFWNSVICVGLWKSTLRRPKHGCVACKNKERGGGVSSLAFQRLLLSYRQLTFQNAKIC